jgi:hypothetical protein
MDVITSNAGPSSSGIQDRDLMLRLPSIADTVREELTQPEFKKFSGQQQTALQIFIVPGV